MWQMKLNCFGIEIVSVNAVKAKFWLKTPKSPASNKKCESHKKKKSMRHNLQMTLRSLKEKIAFYEKKKSKVKIEWEIVNKANYHSLFLFHFQFDMNKYSFKTVRNIMFHSMDVSL